jgi:glycosyltransferase involved in cell wall biosynthesis
VFQSAYDKNDFLSRNPLAVGKLSIIGGNIGLPRFTHESMDINTSIKLRKVLFMGTLGERKGLRYLIEAIALLHRDGHSELELHIAGPGTEQEKKQFERFAVEHGISGAIRFYGRVPSTFPLMAECDLMVMPSLFDSFPDVILLALHAGIPVLGSRVGGIPEMLSCDELLVPARDSAAIAALLFRCLEEPGHYERLRSLCSTQRGRFLFDWVEAWERVAGELVKK